MTEYRPFFSAKSTLVGTCPNPSCRAVHVHLLDEDEVSRAQFAFHCDDIEEFIDHLRVTRDRIVRGGANKGLDQ